jgi:hypothetical protein
MMHGPEQNLPRHSDLAEQRDTFFQQNLVLDFQVPPLKVLNAVCVSPLAPVYESPYIASGVFAKF